MFRTTLPIGCSRRGHRGILVLAAILGLTLLAGGLLHAGMAAGKITTVAGTGKAGKAGGEGPALKAQLDTPTSIAVTQRGDLFICDTGNGRVCKVTATTGLITTLVKGDFFSPLVKAPTGVAIDEGGNLFIVDRGKHQVLKMPAGTTTLSAIAGSGKAGFAGDGGAATAAKLNKPAAIVLDQAGNLYIADAGNHRVRRVDVKTGAISTYAGTGGTDFIGLSGNFNGGDKGPATNASLSNPSSLALDANGNLYIADTGHRRIRKVSAKDGAITTIAGNGLEIDGKGVDGGDGKPAINASFCEPCGIAIDKAGNLYVADCAVDAKDERATSSRVRVIDTEGIIHPFAGTRRVGYAGDDGPPEKAELWAPRGIDVAANGDVYIADTLNHVIRKVTAE